MPSQRQNPRNVSCRPSPLPDDIVSIPAVSPVISSHLHPSRHSLRAALVVVGTWPVRRAPHHHLVLASSKRSIPGGAARRGAAWRLVSTHPSPSHAATQTQTLAVGSAIVRHHHLSRLFGFCLFFHLEAGNRYELREWEALAAFRDSLLCALFFVSSVTPDFRALLLFCAEIWSGRESPRLFPTSLSNLPTSSA